MKNRLKYLSPIFIIILTFLYNEYVIYYQILSKCEFPTLNNDDSINVMLIADTHLLGSRHGHWFDKLRREWQQYRAYQTANYLLKPNYIIILGDLTDEGKWCSDNEWNYYINRTLQLFSVDETTTKLFILVGNHDIGFHYAMNDHLLQRFNRSFTKQFIDFNQLDDNNKNNVNFIFLNSMALENDKCKFCKEAQLELKQLNFTLNCMKNNKNCDKIGRYKINKNKKYNKPIVFTHFPLYRNSDSICPFDIDSEPIDKRYNYKQNFDCLSFDSTKQLIKALNPRLVFSGHTHYSCYNNIHDVPEYTVASFSWRNIKTPSMLLLTINDDNYLINKCFLPSELTVFKIYTILSIFLFLYFLYLIKFIKLFNLNYTIRRLKSN